MTAIRTIGIVLLVLGGLALAYGGFSYTRTTHEADLGPVEVEVKDRETIQIPLWAGLGAVVAGALMLVAGSRQRA